MKQIGIKKDNNLFTRLFWLFDLNNDGKIDSNEFAYSINLFKEFTLDDKVECKYSSYIIPFQIGRYLFIISFVGTGLSFF